MTCDFRGPQPHKKKTLAVMKITHNPLSATLTFFPECERVHRARELARAASQNAVISSRQICNDATTHDVVSHRPRSSPPPPCSCHVCAWSQVALDAARDIVLEQPRTSLKHSVLHLLGVASLFSTTPLVVLQCRTHACSRLRIG